MAAPSFMLGDESEAPEGASVDAAMPDPREAAAKALMSALKSGNAMKFADAFEEMLMSVDSGDDEMEEPPMDDAMPPSTSGGGDMPF